MKTKTTLLIASLLIASLHAQEKPADPYRGTPAAVKAPAENSKAESEPDKNEPKNISICYEAFSLPLAMAAELQRQQLSDPELYTKLISELGKESVKQEVLQIVRGRSGQRSTSESISEHIYPTEYQPTKSGNEIAAKPDSEPGSKPDSKPDSKPASVGVGVYAAAWETRNVGHTLEVEPDLSEDDRFLDLRLFPQIVTLTGYSNWETPSSPDIKMPEFDKQSVDTSATLTLDKPFLLGTVSRPPASKMDSDSANRVWFAFVTATLAKN
jgi:hypothetical protein